MVKLSDSIKRIEKKNILVAGDLIVDRYTVGQAKRISPEAPVAVVNVNYEEQRPGGAGNVALNLLSLGASVQLLSRVGNDAVGKELVSALQSEGVDTQGIITEDFYPTPLKNRIIASGQQIVRVDHEVVSMLREEQEEQMIAALPALLVGCDTVAISDYGKGCMTVTLLSVLISECRARGIPVIADPKGTDFTRYGGATILKPNTGEAYAAAGLARSDSLSLAASLIFKKAQVDVLMVTRSEEGVSLYYADGSEENYPVEAQEIKDVTGAGDTVLAMTALAIANRLTFGEVAQLANVAGGIAISQFGCARVSLSDIARKLLEKEAINKAFGQAHLCALLQAAQERRFDVLAPSLEEYVWRQKA